VLYCDDGRPLVHAQRGILRHHAEKKTSTKTDTSSNILEAMQAEPHFSWLREFAVPVFFTLFGAALGYIATLIRDERKASRDKQAFLRAVGMELDALSKQLDDSLYEVQGFNG